MLLIQNKDPKKRTLSTTCQIPYTFSFKKITTEFSFFLFVCICVKKQHDFNTLMPGGNKRPCALNKPAAF